MQDNGAPLESHMQRNTLSISYIIELFKWLGGVRVSMFHNHYAVDPVKNNIYFNIFIYRLKK